MSRKPGTSKPSRAQSSGTADRSAAPRAMGDPRSSPRGRETGGSPEAQTVRDYGMTGNTAHRPEEFNPDDFE